MIHNQSYEEQLKEEKFIPDHIRLVLISQSEYEQLNHKKNYSDCWCKENGFTLQRHSHLCKHNLVDIKDEEKNDLAARDCQ